MRGTAKRPRLTVFRSNKHTYLQVIDDDKGVTITASSDLGKKSSTAKAAAGSKLERATQVAQKMLQQLEKKKIKQLVFDRGAYRYHGRVKTVAEVMRKGKIKV